MMDYSDVSKSKVQLAESIGYDLPPSTRLRTTALGLFSSEGWTRAQLCASKGEHLGARIPQEHQSGQQVRLRSQVVPPHRGLRQGCKFRRRGHEVERDENTLHCSYPVRHVSRCIGDCRGQEQHLIFGRQMGLAEQRFGKLRPFGGCGSTGMIVLIQQGHQGSNGHMQTRVCSGAYHHRGSTSGFSCQPAIRMPLPHGTPNSGDDGRDRKDCLEPSRPLRLGHAQRPPLRPEPKEAVLGGRRNLKREVHGGRRGDAARIVARRATR